MPKRLTANDLIDKANQIHNFKYDYSKVEYINNKTKVLIVCNLHGEFEQAPENHLKGNGCPKCYYSIIGNSSKMSKPEFLGKAKTIHENKFDYSLVEYKQSKIKVCIICHKHGSFWQTPNDHLKGQGCPKCNISKGEIRIKKWLENNYIDYIQQKTFDNLFFKDQRLPLRFDFYLPNHKVCIEFNGMQHYRSVKYWGGNEALVSLQQRDSTKKQYCKDNNIKLLEIPYWEMKNIELILKDIQ
jgi:very-short-patch-repair endonuclease